MSMETLKIIEDEKTKRKAAEEAMVVEVRKRKEFEEQMTKERKEFEDQITKDFEERIVVEQKRRAALEDDMHIMKEMLFQLQPSLKKKVRFPIKYLLSYVFQLQPSFFSKFMLKISVAPCFVA
ncbi:hypothetical protein Dimus_039283 [Dionaea muscipula]